MAKIPESTWDTVGWTRVRGSRTGNAGDGRNGAGKGQGGGGGGGRSPFGGSIGGASFGGRSHGADRNQTYESTEYLSASVGAGLYKSSGMGVGGIGGGAGYRAMPGGEEGRDPQEMGPGGLVGSSLREHVEAEARDKPQESFTR